jgi:putative ABC transport system permease protein
VLRRAVAALASIDPSLPSQSSVVTMEQGTMQIQRMMAQLPALVASALGLLALILAAVGIYGTVSYRVAQRTREIGIRLALGARDSDVIRMVLRDGLSAVGWGAGLGLVGSFGISALLSKLLVMPDVPDLTYGAGAFDPATFLGVLAVLATAVLTASYGPVRRATRVEPTVALREQ